MKEQQKIIEAALRLLDFQDRTSAELKEKLLKKGFEVSRVGEAVAYLQESGIVDDRRYAELFAADRFDSGKGRSWIRNKLAMKGVARDIIDEALETALQEVDERILCFEKALGICGLADAFEVTSDGEIVPVSHDFDSGSEDQDDSEWEPVRYFYRKVPEGETDRNIIYKEHEKAKASLTRRLVSAGYPAGMAFEAVRKIDDL